VLTGCAGGENCCLAGLRPPFEDGGSLTLAVITELTSVT
jgi:hypothetical protein